MGEKREPTKMGQRILDFMAANHITNRAQFAEGVLGISRQSFHAWLYKPMKAENVAARPILICADALGTNPEYLLCMTDDPRPAMSLTYEESLLVQSYRDLSEADRRRLMKNAADWVAENHAAPSAVVPFRVRPGTER